MPTIMRQIEIIVREDKSYLHRCHPPAKDILYFTFSPHHEIADLPGVEGLDANLASNPFPRMDILRQEASKLIAMFVRQFNPALRAERRIKLFRDILASADDQERRLLMGIVHHRQINGITYGDVVQAYGENFFAPMLPPELPVQQVPRQAEPLPEEYESFQPLSAFGIIQY
jgi:hypothetical protein